MQRATAPVRIAEGHRRRARRLAALLIALGIIALAPLAWAGSYLDRASLLVTHATEDADYLRGRLDDAELARVVHRVAVARVRAAKKMTVPKEVTQAHPHLLLLLENYERAASAARDGSAERFLIYQQRARDEEKNFRGILKQLGWPLPKLR